MNDSCPIPEAGVSEVLLRRFLNKVCGLLPDSIQYTWLAGLKRRWNAFRGNNFERLFHSWDHLDSGKATGNDNTGAVFSITHDVDYVECYKFLPTLIELDRELGIKATYNFLTNARYEIEDRVLFAILDKGNEIGLHGKNHDRALGSRSETYIHDFVSSGQKELERRIGKIHGFRTPALAVTARVIEVLARLGFKYDSSLTNCGLQSNFVSFFHPCKIADAGLMEIPMTIQDSMFTNDVPLSSGEIDRIIIRLVDLAKRNAGALVLNFHPVIISSNSDTYTRIAEILTKSSLRQSLMKDLI